MTTMSKNIAVAALCSAANVSPLLKRLVKSPCNRSQEEKLDSGLAYEGLYVEKWRLKRRKLKRQRPYQAFALVAWG